MNAGRYVFSALLLLGICGCDPLEAMEAKEPEIGNGERNRLFWPESQIRRERQKSNVTRVPLSEEEAIGEIGEEKGPLAAVVVPPDRVPKKILDQVVRDFSQTAAEEGIKMKDCSFGVIVYLAAMPIEYRIYYGEDCPPNRAAVYIYNTELKKLVRKLYIGGSDE